MMFKRSVVIVGVWVVVTLLPYPTSPASRVGPGAGTSALVARAAPLLAQGSPPLAPARALPRTRLTRLEIARREQFADGARFGITGPYEKLVGTAYLEIDPTDAHNALIHDLSLAPRTSRATVEYSTDVYILKPVDMSLSNGIILYEPVNRGNKLALGFFNHGAPFQNDLIAAGDGFLQERGYILVWSGWQPDVLPGNGRMTMRVPVTRHPDGSPITGRVRAELIVTAPTATLLLSSGWYTGLTHASYPTNSLDTSTAVLTRRTREADPREVVPASGWVFADCTTTPFPGNPDPTRICLREMFQPNFIYELTYTARDPLVLGLGFAATREFVSFLRYAPSDDRGTPNPLAGQIRLAMMFGASQSGGYIRTFLDLGFNEDSSRRIVFDGMWPHIAPWRIALNVRFGQPGRGSSQHEDHAYPRFEPPLTWTPDTDPVTGRLASLLDRCQQQRRCPKVIHTVSSTEYWQGRMSTNTTDALGPRDLAIPPNVRVYFFAGTQHVPAPSPALGICQQLSNPNPYQEAARALLVALEQWVRSGVQPPPNQIPTVRDGTLVRPDKASVGWPDVPGVRYEGLVNDFPVLDFGPLFDRRNESGIVREPPAVVGGHHYVVLVPKVDADGNEIAGVHSTTLQAPLGTYTGWNLRRAGFAEGELCSITGAFIPFARTRAERVARNDPRPSLEERYGVQDAYVAAVRAAADRLVAQRFLVPEDARRLVDEAQARRILAGQVTP